MKITDPLTARQLAVLTWIGEGCTVDVMFGSSYKTAAIALQSGRLGPGFRAWCQ